jgi:glycosyltransferase involved in cell wall biosynthesis
MENCHALIAPYGKNVSKVGGGDISRWMSPLKLFEYMAAGRPIVASDLPVIREILINKVNSLLCNPENLEEWRLAFLRIMSESTENCTLGENARETLLKEYTWQKRAKMLLRL